MKKTNSKKIFNNKKLEHIAAIIGVALLLCVYPFIFSRGYSDITYTRFMFFCVVSIVIFAICAIKLLSATTSVKLSLKKYFLSLTAVDKAFWCFFAATFFSFVLSEYKLAALFGDLGRYMGFLLFLSVFLMYLWVSRFYQLTERMMRAFGIICIVIAIFTLLQFKGADLFGFIKAVPFEKRRNFLSPFGNINVFASFLSVATPFSMYMFCFTQKENAKAVLFYGTLCAANFISLLTSNSDSIYVMFAAVLVVLLILSCEKPEAFNRFLLLCAIFFGATILFAVIHYIVKGNRDTSSLTKVYITSILPYAGALISFVIYQLFSKRPLCANTLRKIRKAIIISVILCIVAVASCMIYFTKFNTTADLGFLNHYLRFNDSWGTDRGYLWTRLIRIFSEASLKEKLFGFGEETVSVVMIKNYLTEMRTQLGYLFDNAHNEFLHYLITTGLFGLGSYIAVLFCAIMLYKKQQTSLLQKALILSVIGYCVQSFFNIIQPIATPFIFITVALIRCRSENTDSTTINTQTISDNTIEEV